ncbi:MAG: rRNA maturation RNase YbeY [Lachnospiraceae bacterium]|nr:rRNA maturation RNase YbeY [Lachnospiraceae bacterium]MBR5788501.1 rRNA maturation RNase YbeY [Lachnospiraceae bacterium]
MTLDLVNETDIEFDFSYEEIAKKVIDATLEHENFPYDVSVSLTLTDEDSIREINRVNRDIDRVTDVLSFPFLDFPTRGDYGFLDDDDTAFDPDTGEVILGDIVICLKRVIEQAEEYGHSKLREYAFLICHSMLHLLSYDHMTKEEEAEMFGKQREILDNLGIVR